MSGLEETNIAVVRRYFDGCNSGKLEEILPTLAPDVVHYFLSPGFPTIHGAEHLARYWSKFKVTGRPLWRIDEIIGRVIASIANGVASGIRRKQDGKSCPVVLNGASYAIL